LLSARVRLAPAHPPGNKTVAAVVRRTIIFASIRWGGWPLGPAMTPTAWSPSKITSLTVHSSANFGARLRALFSRIWSKLARST
jgi:hypothetical protein